MKLMASAMFSAATKTQHSSVLTLLCHCLPVFDEIYGTAVKFVFFVRVTLANCDLDMSAALLLSVIN